MISKEMNDALNSQVNKEMYSSNLYLAMSAWLAEKGLPGFASWMRAQADEEYQHCMKIFDYIIERGGSVDLGEVAKPNAVWQTPLQVCEEVVSHEAEVTADINDLMDIAFNVKDHAAAAFLQWFVSEQVEEEASVGEVLDRMKMIGEQTAGLYHLDMELAKRTIAPIDGGANAN